MRISKLQLEFIEYVERCGYLYLNEINYSKYPESLIECLIEKELLFENDGKIASTTKRIKL